MTLHIFLIRHGETDWSASGKHTGTTDIALSPKGEDQARLIGERVKGMKFDCVLTSPLQRARRTCELAGLGDQAQIEPELREWDYGDYEGRTSAEIHHERPDWNLFRDGCPNGDSPNQICERADQVASRIRNLTGNVAIFSHGHFLRVLAARWIKLPVDGGARFLLDTATLSILGYEHDNPQAPVIALWNAGKTQAQLLK